LISDDAVIDRRTVMPYQLFSVYETVILLDLTVLKTYHKFCTSAFEVGVINCYCQHRTLQQFNVAVAGNNDNLTFPI